MVAEGVNEPLLVIVGETASGKSALAIKLAKKFDGEIICADSRTVYRGMDIGTAKPTREDREKVPHHCLDLVEPDEPFTVADFKREALLAMADITARGKLPILVGGSGLYLDAILYDYTFRAPSDKSVRSELTALSIEELQKRLLVEGIPLPNNPQNPRHLVRALETGGAEPTRQELRPNTMIVGLKVEREVLKDRIIRRIDQMVDHGLIDEVQRVSEKYGWEAPALQAPAYKAFRDYIDNIDGSISLDEAKAMNLNNDLRLAKRQRTWFKRNKSIHWFDNRGNLTEIVELTTTFLNK
jgi:tRNA dimethylallyltransferase